MQEDEVLQQLLENMPDEYESLVTVLQIQARNASVILESAKNCLMEYEAKQKLKSDANHGAPMNTTVMSARKSNGGHPNRGPRCYGCNNYGHIARFLPRQIKEKGEIR